MVARALLLALACSIAACARSLMVAPETTSTTAHGVVGGVAFDYPERMEIESGALGDEYPTVLVGSEQAYAMVSVARAGVDPDLLHEQAEGFLRADVLQGRRMDPQRTGPLAPRRIAGKDARGTMLVTNEGPSSAIAEIYTLALADKSVLLVFVYLASNAEHDRAMFELIAKSVQLDTSGGS